MAIKHLMFTGGINHDFEDTADAISDLLQDAGIETTIVTDMDAGFASLREARWPLVTMFTLRWRMLDDDKYIPHRQQWAYEIPERDRQTLLAHVQSGGGLLGLHTAAICFDTWPDWSSLLGAKWVWGSTFHPPPQTLTVTPLSGTHPVTTGISAFPVVDELYHHIEPGTDSEPLLKTFSAEDNSEQLLAWANTRHTGRVIYSSLAHDRLSVTAPGHTKFLRQAARWCAGVDP